MRVLVAIVACALLGGCYDVSFGGNTDRTDLVPADDDDDATFDDDDASSDDDDDDATADDDDDAASGDDDDDGTPVETVCDDGADNDADGLFDCNDPDCADDPACDDPTPPPPETDCSDGADNDGDSLTDCDDPDCDAISPCDQPTVIWHTGDVFFDGWEITCDTGLFDIDVDIDDCQTVWTSSLGAPTTVPPCTVCDATFEGPFTYSTDSCASLIDQPSPGSGAYGLVFTSPSQWEFYARNEDTGVWESGGFAVNDGTGTYTFTATDVVSGSPDDCNWPTDQDLGQLTLTLTFTDAS